MTEGLWTAVIGVAGTLLGTALGWFLNVFANKGKLKFYVTSWENEFEKMKWVKWCQLQAPMMLNVTHINAF